MTKPVDLSVRLSVGLILLILGFVSGSLFQSHWSRISQPGDIRITQEFEKEFLEAYSDILINTQMVLLMNSTTTETWQRAIDARVDFGQSIQAAFEGMKRDGRKNKMDEMNSEIDSLMLSIKVHPLKYNEPYEALFELYLVYSQLYQLAWEPTGSLVSFNQKVNELKSRYIQALTKMRSVLPLIEDEETVSELLPK